MDEQLKIVEDHSDESEPAALLRRAGEDSEQSNNNGETVQLTVVDDAAPDFRERDEPKKPKNRRPLNTRPQHAQMSGLKNMMQAKDQEIMNLRAALEQRQFEAQQAQQIAVHKDHIAVANHEYALKLKKEEAKRVMTEAMDAGDTEKAAEANEAMVDVSTQLARLEDFKNAPQFQPQQMEMNPSYNYPDPDLEPIYNDLEEEYEPDVIEQLEQEEMREEELERVREEREIAEDFLRKNPWADPNSDSYDKMLHIKFSLKANRLKQVNVLEGNADYANSKDFLDDVVEELLSETKKTLGNRSTSTQRSSSMVSPVSRGGGSSGRGSSDEYKITRAEMEAVSRLPEIMKEKDVNKLGLQYLRIKKDLAAKGELGRGLQPRHQGFSTSSTPSGGY
jgi:hypothetical protein